MAIRDSQARSASALAELSGPRTTARTTSSSSRRIDTLLPDAAPVPEHHMEHPPQFRFVAEDLGPATRLDRHESVGRHLPEERREVDSSAPPANAHRLLMQTREHAHRVVERRQRRVDTAGVDTGRRRSLRERGNSLAQTLGGPLRLLRQEPAQFLSGQPTFGHAA